MTDSNQTDTRDPAEIERDIQATQRDMSRTADQIGDQFTPRNLFNGLLDKADENGIDARYVLDSAKRNPIALAMISLGGIWLVSDSDARAASLKPPGLGSFGKTQGSDPHRDYVEHMSRCEPNPGEDEMAYRRRRTLSRSNYLMIEQGHGEDESSFSDRLDQATEKLRNGRDAMVHGAQGMGRSVSSGASDLGSKAASMYRENPLVGGAIAALAGAMIGAALPATRTEEEQLGPMGVKALDAATDKAHEMGDMARDKKDELVGEMSGSEQR